MSKINLLIKKLAQVQTKTMGAPRRALKFCSTRNFKAASASLTQN